MDEVASRKLNCVLLTPPPPIFVALIPEGRSEAPAIEIVPLVFNNMPLDPRTPREVMIAGLLLMIYIRFETRIAFTWYVVIGTAATFLTGYVMSLFLKEPQYDRTTSPAG